MIPKRTTFRYIFSVLFGLLIGSFQVGNALKAQQPGSTHQELLKSEDYIGRYGNLSNTLYRIKKERNINVVFYGGSITHNPGWRDQVMDYLQKQFPETRFNFLNAGIPSLGSLPHAFRIHHDVLSKGRADLVFLESAVNDSGNGTPPLTQRRALEGIIRQLTAHNPYTDIVMMAFVDPDKIKAYNAGQVPAEVGLHEALAKKFMLPFINLAREVRDRINAGEFTWERDFKNLHPSPFGQNIYFRSIQQLLSRAFDQSVPEKLLAHDLPKKTDPLVYAKGTYLDISKAANLKGFELISNWKPTDSAHGRAGFVNIPVLSAREPGASFTLDFTGNAIGFAVLAGPDVGIVSYTIDGKAYPEMDLYTPWSKKLHLPWYLLFADDLKLGPHQLKLTLNGTQNKSSAGTACRIAYFLLNDPAN
ncbi:SGNH/GDSL hydrolase family protein [Pedobacter sp. MC2016-24]|uniref:SGNH/GDSL hydrolase family protein n=1 Tax=Pedobacter sp. MC2016-24 TaxID=2780090 RepID=UPI00188002B4|nr:SGNH/GDSL hydrolase family protein [Pedobacter sp. MC2016-24]MBE9601464.1 SGNH/GDSL hydrolase family protein [Pedobacter sp. MC2016-24]